VVTSVSPAFSLWGPPVTVADTGNGGASVAARARDVAGAAPEPGLTPRAPLVRRAVSHPGAWPRTDDLATTMVEWRERMNCVRRGPITAPTPPAHDATAGDGACTHILQCRLPPHLYEWLRLQAFQTRHPMNSIVLAAVGAYRAEREAGRTTWEGRVTGGGATAPYNVRLDDERYEWLRTTAFATRSSINALVVAALARAQADHVEGAAAPDA